MIYGDELSGTPLVEDHQWCLGSESATFQHRNHSKVQLTNQPMVWAPIKQLGATSEHGTHQLPLPLLPTGNT